MTLCGRGRDVNGLGGCYGRNRTSDSFSGKQTERRTMHRWYLAVIAVETLVIAVLLCLLVRAQNGRFKFDEHGNGFDTRTGQACYPLSVRSASMSSDVPLCNDF